LKILSLLRHADASPATRHQPDRDRPLSARGRATCQALATSLASSGAGPDLVLCSTAERARRTLEGLRSALAPRRVVHADALYLASDDALLEQLWTLGDAVRRVLLIGHNPGLELLAARLTGGGDEHARQRAASGLAPAALAELHFDVEDWSALRDRSGRLVRFLTPDPLSG
jgi:phosphohistidine phosphatase